jgi:hypothetical protein
MRSLNKEGAIALRALSKCSISLPVTAGAYECHQCSLTALMAFGGNANRIPKTGSYQINPESVAHFKALEK